MEKHRGCKTEMASSSCTSQRSTSVSNRIRPAKSDRTSQSFYEGRQVHISVTESPDPKDLKKTSEGLQTHNGKVMGDEAARQALTFSMFAKDHGNEKANTSLFRHNSHCIAHSLHSCDSGRPTDGVHTGRRRTTSSAGGATRTCAEANRPLRRGI